MLRRPPAFIPPAETTSPAPAPVQAEKPEAAPAASAPAREAIDYEAFAAALVAALEAVPGVLAQIDLGVGHSETYSLLKARLRATAAPAPAPEPEPVKASEPEPAPEALKPPVIAVRRPGVMRPPATQPRAVTTDAIVQAAAATAAPQRPRQTQDELEKLLAAVGSVEAETETSEDADVIPDAYAEPVISDEEALMEPGEVALADEGACEDPWVNPLRIGLPKPPRPLTEPRGVIVPLAPSTPAPAEDDGEPEWMRPGFESNPNDKGLIARLSAERSDKRRLT
ncbi:hypothetical protein [Chenggangzhangella methanolivorans]|uniref:Uncharacterized protein n=1 Tax=Chenggangzhangella methanolivorans TaxID=1437009 RepID=A0A9E6RGP9_9HYPH|nr:hypothetical protein [Chenggangzhangella methanolivorans]QZO00697.1 hypothetical protein K6K41_03045 [Chenggangzhangella methanolivorans]